MISYKGYYTTRGSNAVSLYSQSSHLLDFLTEKPIENEAYLEEQVNRFIRNSRDFDIIDYTSGGRLVKAQKEKMRTGELQ